MKKVLFTFLSFILAISGVWAPLYADEPVLESPVYEAPTTRIPTVHEAPTVKIPATPSTTLRDMSFLPGQPHNIDAIVDGLINPTPNRYHEHLKVLPPHQTLTIIGLDLNKLKPTNDILGHNAGDLAIRNALKKIVIASLKHGYTPMRIGGDEFAMIKVGHTNPQEIRLVTLEIQQAVRGRILANGQLIPTSVSVGAAHLPASPHEPAAGVTVGERLNKQADIGMYENKHIGGEPRVRTANINGQGRVEVQNLPPLTGQRVRNFGNNTLRSLGNSNAFIAGAITAESLKSFFTGETKNLSRLAQTFTTPLFIADFTLSGSAYALAERFLPKTPVELTLKAPKTAFLKGAARRSAILAAALVAGEAVRQIMTLTKNGENLYAKWLKAKTSGTKEEAAQAQEELFEAVEKAGILNNLARNGFLAVTSAGTVGLFGTLLRAAFATSRAAVAGLKVASNTALLAPEPTGASKVAGACIMVVEAAATYLMYELEDKLLSVYERYTEKVNVEEAKTELEKALFVLEKAEKNKKLTPKEYERKLFKFKQALKKFENAYIHFMAFLTTYSAPEFASFVAEGEEIEQTAQRNIQALEQEKRNVLKNIVRQNFDHPNTNLTLSHSIIEKLDDAQSELSEEEQSFLLTLLQEEMIRFEENRNNSTQAHDPLEFLKKPISGSLRENPFAFSRPSGRELSSLERLKGINDFMALTEKNAEIRIVRLSKAYGNIFKKKQADLTTSLPFEARKQKNLQRELAYQSAAHERFHEPTLVVDHNNPLAQVLSPQNNPFQELNSLFGDYLNPEQKTYSGSSVFGNSGENVFVREERRSFLPGVYREDPRLEIVDRETGRSQSIRVAFQTEESSFLRRQESRMPGTQLITPEGHTVAARIQDGELYIPQPLFASNSFGSLCEHGVVGCDYHERIASLSELEEQAERNARLYNAHHLNYSPIDAIPSAIEYLKSNKTTSSSAQAEMEAVIAKLSTMDVGVRSIFENSSEDPFDVAFTVANFAQASKENLDHIEALEEE